MDSLREQAIAAQESCNLLLAYDLWGELAESDTDGVASLKYGALAIELEKWEVAESALMNALRLKPHASIVMAFLGRLWAHRTDRDQAESLQIAKQWYLRSLERKRIAPCLTLLGSVCVRLNEFPEANAAFEEAIAIDPNYDEAMYNLAVLEEENDPDRCIALLKRAIEIDPDYSIAHQVLGRTFQRRRDFVAAEFHFRRCLEIDPDDYWSNLFPANLLGATKRNDEAAQAYKRTVALRPEVAAGFDYFAKFLESIGKAAEAAEVRSQGAKTAADD